MQTEKIDLRNKGIEVLDRKHGCLVKKFFEENGITDVLSWEISGNKREGSRNHYYFINEDYKVRRGSLQNILENKIELIELPDCETSQEDINFNYDPTEVFFIPNINKIDYTETAQLFDKTIEETISQLQETLLVKGKEYRRNGNPFHNFEEGARKENKTREEVLHGFALKHEISISDMRNDLSKGIMPKVEQVNEKFNDLIIYLLIEKASILDKLQLKQTENAN
jgi:hypothetical protein